MLMRARISSISSAAVPGPDDVEVPSNRAAAARWATVRQSRPRRSGEDPVIAAAGATVASCGRGGVGVLKAEAVASDCQRND